MWRSALLLVCAGAIAGSYVSNPVELIVSDGQPGEFDVYSYAIRVVVTAFFCLQTISPNYLAMAVSVAQAASSAYWFGQRHVNVSGLPAIAEVTPFAIGVLLTVLSQRMKTEEEIHGEWEPKWEEPITNTTEDDTDFLASDDDDDDDHHMQNHLAKPSHDNDRYSRMKTKVEDKKPVARSQTPMRPSNPEKKTPQQPSYTPGTENRPSRENRSSHGGRKANEHISPALPAALSPSKPEQSQTLQNAREEAARRQLERTEARIRALRERRANKNLK